MKIGEFARKYGVTKNTVRYYIEHGLLVPACGMQYQFGRQEEEDMELILKMKSEYFSLKEIAAMLSIRHTSNMIEPNTIQDSISLLEQKRVELEHEIGARQKAVRRIAQDISELSSRAGGKSSSMGVPLSALELLACPHCGGALELSDASLNAQNVFSGQLSCSCGYHCQIQDGIIRTGNEYQGGHDWPDLTRGLYRNGGDAFVVQIKKMQDYLLKQLSQMNLHGKVLMETHINGYFFIYNHLDALPEDCLYIVTDKFPEMLEMYKKLIEMLPIRRKILFIADADINLPIRRPCVDGLITCMSDTEHSLYSRVPYIQAVAPYLKEQAVVCGGLFGYRGENRSQKLLAEKYPEGVPLPFSLDAFLKSYREAGYQVQTQLLGSTSQVEKRDKYCFSCHVDGEILYLYSYRADKIP